MLMSRAMIRRYTANGYVVVTMTATTVTIKHVKTGETHTLSSDAVKEQSPKNSLSGNIANFRSIMRGRGE